MSVRMTIHVDAAQLAQVQAVMPVRPGIPQWLASQRRCRGECERCGRRGDSMYAGTDEWLCWGCLDVARAAVQS